MANPFKIIGSFFKKLGKGIGSAVVSFLKSDAVKGLLKTAEGQIVAAVVADMANVADLSPEQRRGEALKRIAKEFAKAGLTFKESLARLLIEVVVSRLKGQA
jgi:ATP:corrinoid adenosyltransferase